MSFHNLDSTQTGTAQLFQILRDGVPRTRAELSKLTGLARSTVTARVEELLRLGLIMPIADAMSTGGRPSSQFVMNPNARLIVAADLGATHATLAITDLAGVVLAEKREPLEIKNGPAEAVEWIRSMTEDLLSDIKRSSKDIAAFGVGVPGPVEHKTGMPVQPPIMPGWDRADIPGMIQELFPVPVLVDNDVNIMALGEQAIAYPDKDNLVFVKVATGIGSGLISGGELLRGAIGVAGDIGHVQVARALDVLCSCGNYGCLEAVASGPAIAASLREQGLDATTGNDVVELVKQGNVEAIRAVHQAGRDLGEVLTTCVRFINPSVIVIGGGMARVGEHLIAGAREIVYSRSTPIATEYLTIVRSIAGTRAAIIGANILATRYIMSPEMIDSILLTN